MSDVCGPALPIKPKETNRANFHKLEQEGMVYGAAERYMMTAMPGGVGWILTGVAGEALRAAFWAAVILLFWHVNSQLTMAVGIVALLLRAGEISKKLYGGKNGTNKTIRETARTELPAIPAPPRNAIPACVLLPGRNAGREGRTAL